MDKKSGYLVKVQDKEDLYIKTNNVLNLPYEQKVEMGKLARKHMEDNFDKNDVVNETIKQVI